MKLSSQAGRIVFCVAAASVALHQPTALGAEFTYRDGVSEVYRMPLCARPPTVDGKIDPAEWRGATQIDGFGDDQRRARGYVMATADALFLAVRSQLPDKGDLVINVARDNTAAMVHDDSVEFWITPPDATAEKGRRFQFMTNPNACRWAAIHGWGGVDGRMNWECDWETKSSLRDDGHWHCEARIPIDRLTALPIAAGGWNINLWRNWKNPWLQTFMIGRVFDEKSGSWHFTDQAAAPVAHLMERANRFSGEIDLALEILNPCDSPVDVKARLRLERAGGEDVTEEQKLRIAPGESATVALKPDGGKSTAYRLTAAVTGAEDNKIFFRHNMVWKTGNAIAWEAPVTVPQTAFKFRCGYFPYSNTLKVAADIRELPETAHVNRVSVVVRKKTTGKVILRESLDSFAGGKREAEWKLPADILGFYEVVAKAEGENVPEETVTAEIKREKFAWERTCLGVSDEVFPPFEPLRAEGNAVSPVLRTYRMNEQGLWDSVVAKGKEILAAPMRYVAIDEQGEELTWAGEVRMESNTPHRVVYTAKASCPAVSLHSVSTIEMDGLMLVKLRLEPVPDPRPLKRLSLEIPLVDKECYLMHQVHDGLRRNYAGRTPGGEGEIWNSKAIYSDRRWLNAFNGYLWLGGGERGLCWLAENDRGWITAKTFDEPLQRIIREKGRLVMRVDLVNVPGAIAKSTDLVYGVQASPTRPPLTRLGLFHGAAHGFSPVVAWGGMAECSWKQPWGNRWEVIDTMLESKVTGELDKKWFQEFEEANDIPRINQGQRWSDHTTFIFEHMTHSAGLHGPMHVYFEEMVVSKSMPEYHVFQDEWKALVNDPRSYAGMEEYRRLQDVGGGPGSAQTTWPTSELDYLLSLMNEWFRRGIAVKYDNFYPKASDNPWTSAAYEAEDGRIQPAILFWNQREYIRRAWNLLNHWKRVGTTRPLDIHTHMSTTQIIPWFSWTTINCDLEYDPDTHAQLFPDVFETGDPYDPDFLLTETAGRQVGVIPISFPLFKAKAYPMDVLGTAPGAMAAAVRDWGMKAVHEISGAANLPMSAFGYGVCFSYRADRIKVWNYWDDDSPCHIDNDRVRWLLLARPEDKKLLLILQSWEKGPVDVKVALDPERIGFAPGLYAYEAFNNRRWRVEGETMDIRLEFPYETQVIEFHHEAPPKNVLFADTFDKRFDFGWAYDYAQPWFFPAPGRKGDAMYFTRDSHRLFTFMNLPDFSDATLSFSFGLDALAGNNGQVLSVAFPALPPKPSVLEHTWSGLPLDDLGKRFVVGGLELQLDVKNGQLAWTGPAVSGKTPAPVVSGPADTALHKVRIRSGADGSYTVSVDGKEIIARNGVAVTSGRAFGFKSRQDVGRAIPGFRLDDVVLEAEKVDYARLEAERNAAQERSARHRASRRDELLERIRAAFGVDGSKALRALAYFNNAKGDARKLLDRLENATTDAQRQVTLALLAELPRIQKEHQTSMTAIGQPAVRLPEFREARDAVESGLKTLLPRLDAESRKLAEKLAAE